VIWRTTGVLNLNLYLPQPHFEHLFPVAAIGPEDNARLGKYFELAAVRNLEYTPAIVARNNDLLRLDDVTRIESPQSCVVPKHGDLPCEIQEPCSTARTGGRLVRKGRLRT
jgi:hypothetical protein